MTQPFKVCPKCQSPADLNAAQCVQCGRQYKTQFTAPPPADHTQMFTLPPTQPTQAFTPAPTQPMPRLTKTLLVLGILCACAYLFNTLQVWYVEARAIKAKQEYDTQQEQQRAEREQQSEQNKANEREYYRNYMRSSG